MGAVPPGFPKLLEANTRLFLDSWKKFTVVPLGCCHRKPQTGRLWVFIPYGSGGWEVQGFGVPALAGAAISKSSGFVDGAFSLGAPQRKGLWRSVGLVFYKGADPTQGGRALMAEPLPMVPTS